MQLVWVVAAGAALAWLYLAAFRVLLCGPNAPRMSLLLAMFAFVNATGIVLALMWLISDGHFERFTASLIGFVAARALLEHRVLGRLDELESEAGAFGSDTPETLRQHPLDRLA